MPARLSGGASVESELTWRCPECHTVQARTARCWRCSRPVFTCQTCSLYQPSVAADLGTCADDPTGPMVAATQTRTCWKSSPSAAVPSGRAELGGLFSELEPVKSVAHTERPRPVRTVPSLRRAPDRAARSEPTPSSRDTQPRVEDAGRAAWVEADQDRLVDAPAVDPGKRSTTGVQRRRRRWFR